jgi:hypothetical protein
MALYTQTASTDLSSKGRRLTSIHVASTGATTVNIREGAVGGAIRYQVVAATGTTQTINFATPVIFPTGVYVELSAGTVSAITVDIL